MISELIKIVIIWKK